MVEGGSLSPSEEIEVARALLKGDESAWEELYARYSGEAMKTARKYRGVDPEDVVQQAFKKLAGPSGRSTLEKVVAETLRLKQGLNTIVRSCACEVTRKRQSSELAVADPSVIHPSTVRVERHDRSDTEGALTELWSEVGSCRDRLSDINFALLLLDIRFTALRSAPGNPIEAARSAASRYPIEDAWLSLPVSPKKTLALAATWEAVIARVRQLPESSSVGYEVLADALSTSVTALYKRRSRLYERLGVDLRKLLAEEDRRDE